MTRLMTASAAAALSLTAAPAFAHDGDHSANVLANIMHWLSSPTHSLFAVIGGVVISATIVAVAKKRRA